MHILSTALVQPTHNMSLDTAHGFFLKCLNQAILDLFRSKKTWQCSKQSWFLESKKPKAGQAMGFRGFEKPVEEFCRRFNRRLSTKNIRLGIIFCKVIERHCQ